MTGGCLCNAVRYQVEGDPVLTGVCHCTHCQKQSGTSFSIFVMVRRESLKLTGTTGMFETTGDSGGKVQRHFCRECGSPIYSDVAIAPKYLILKAGTLDDRSWLKPAMHIWCDSAQPWLPADDVPRHPKGG